MRMAIKPPHRMNNMGYVYFAQDGKKGIVKVGYTRALLQHLELLKFDKLNDKLLGVLSGDLVTEKLVHRQFKPYRYQKEWYYPSPELLNWITDNTDEQYMTLVLKLESIERDQRDKLRRAISRRKQPLKRARMIALGNNARARRMGIPGTITGVDVHLHCTSQRGLCWWCGNPYGVDWQLDHRIPLTRGGTNWPRNTCITCRSCNNQKLNLLPSEWIGRLL